MAQELISHKVLSLDFWQDTVTYAGSVMPTGTIGCAVLNIPDETITRLDAPCKILNQLLTGIGLKNVDMQLLPKAQEAGRAIIHELHDVQPFSHLDRKQFEDYLMQAFSEKAFAELNEYLQLPMEQQTVSNITGAHPLAGAPNPRHSCAGASELFPAAVQNDLDCICGVSARKHRNTNAHRVCCRIRAVFQGECHFGGKRSFVDGTDQCDGAVCPRDPSRQCGGAACQADALCILRRDVPRRSF